VDRALDPELLAVALGEQTDRPLPSPGELQDLLAAAEIGLLMQSTRLDEDLLNAGWYLHSVASAAAEGPGYSAARQRRAWQVSGHVFDLALADTSRSADSRLAVAFAAQVGYQRSGLEPNAMAVYRQATSLIPAPGSVPLRISTLPLEIAVTLMGFDRRTLFRYLRDWNEEFKKLERTIQGPSDGTMYGASASILRGANAFLRYLTLGSGRDLTAAHRYFEGVAQALENDITSRWIAAQLDAVARQASQGSVWSTLPENVPTIARQAMTLTDPGVLTLWEPQRQLVQQQRNLLDADVKRVVMALPTSAGKTLLAQLILVSHLSTESTGVCYVAPLRSLGREVRRAIRSRLKVLHRELGPELPDFQELFGGSFPGLEGPVRLFPPEEVDVDIMTPERLAHMLRDDPEYVLGRYGLFVFDEAHTVSDPGRGFALEWVLSFLHWRTKGQHQRIVLLSAALGNRAQVRAWVDPADEGVLFESDWRGPRRLHAIFTTRIEWDKRSETPGVSSAYPLRAVYPLRGFVRARMAESAEIQGLQITEPVGEAVRRVPASGREETNLDKKLTTPFYVRVARLADAVSHGGPTLVITSTRSSARRMAKAIAELVPQTSSARPIEQFVRVRLGADHPLVNVLRHGVAYHHAALPSDVLEAIEDGVRAEQIHFVAATSTLTEGVNLPVRTVILAETSYDGQPPEAILRGARLLNAMGRAGRACRESEGWIFLAQNDEESPQDFDTMQVDVDDLVAESRLASDEALTALAILEQALRDGQDVLFADAAREIDDFIAFVWFALFSEEAAGFHPAQARVTELLTATLGFDQIPSEAKDSYLRVAEWIRDRYNETDPTTRRRWVRGGTSVRSAKEIDEIVNRLRLLAAERAGIGQTDVALELLAESETLESVLQLPESSTPWKFKNNEFGRYTEIEVTPIRLLEDWIAGKQFSEIADTHLADVPLREYRLEQMVNSLTQHFEHYLSWMIGIVVSRLNDDDPDDSDDSELFCPALPLYIRYGVNSITAVDLLVGGVRSRQLATAIAAGVASRRAPVANVREWLGGMTITQWRRRFHATPADILDLLEYTRSRRTGLLASVLQDGTATVRLDDPTLSISDDEKVVTLEEPAGRDRRSLFVRDPEGDRVGRIPTSLQSDVEALLATGLPIAFAVERDVLTMRLVDF
jgi:hypothetical protein